MTADPHRPAPPIPAMDAEHTIDDTPATVCLRHDRFVPCRRCDQPTPAHWSTAPADIDRVRRVQAHRVDPVPLAPATLAARLTSVVHNVLAAGGSDADVADAVLAAPDLHAIRLQLGYMANSLATGCADDVNHGDPPAVTLAEHLDATLVAWVLD